MQRLHAGVDCPLGDQRDRENCTVFVADLPTGTNEEQLKALFKDVRSVMRNEVYHDKLNAQCGEIRDIKITNMPETLVATVEFVARVYDSTTRGVMF